MKPVICLDLDGVIHSYTSGWQGPRVISDPAVPGAIHFILTILASQQFTVAIHSSRSRYWLARRAMRKWLIQQAGQQFKHDLMRPTLNDKFGLWSQAGFQTGMGPLEEEMDHAARWLVRQIDWPLYKPPATMTIDDRGMCFQGTFPSVDEIQAFQPWNKQYQKFEQLSNALERGL